MGQRSIGVSRIERVCAADANGIDRWEAMILSRKISRSTRTSQSMGCGGVPIARARLEWQFEHRAPFLIRNNNGPPVRHAPVGVALGQDLL